MHPCTPLLLAHTQRDSRKSEKLREKIMKDSTQELAKAQERKDRLLHYQNTGAARMRVLDDESDYFSHDSNRWLSKEAKVVTCFEYGVGFASWVSIARTCHPWGHCVGF